MSDPDHFDDEDLVSSNPNQRNWRGIFIALLVILVVLGLIVLSVMLLTPPNDDYNRNAKKITLDDIIGHDLTPIHINGSWISGNEFMFKDEWESIVVLNASDLSTKIIMTNMTFKRINPTKFILSPDHRYLLLVHNVQKLFRYSYVADHSVYDMQTKEIFPLMISSDGKEHNRIMHADWSPRGHSLITVHDYDLYYIPDPRSEASYRVTDTGELNFVYNGVTDWLYEEEILKSNSAVWFSPDGRRILYLSFNDTDVEEQIYEWYGTVDETNLQLYPKIKKVRYPKAGTNNPIVSIFTADFLNLTNIKIRQLKAPIEFMHTLDFYICAVTWVGLSEVSLVWMNRLQNISVVTLCKYPSWHCQETHRILGDGKGWVEVPDPPIFAPDGNSYIILGPVQDAPTGYFKHIISVNVTSKSIVPITMGKYTVSKILAWDHAMQVVYFLGIPAERPGQMHLYIVSSVLSRDNVVLLSKCITCLTMPEAQRKAKAASTMVYEPSYKFRPMFNLFDDVETTTLPPEPVKKRKKYTRLEPEPLNQPCTYHNIIFSTTVEYFILDCLGPGIPSISLYATNSTSENVTSEAQNDGPIVTPKKLMVLQNNSKLYEKVSSLAVPPVKTFPVIITGGNIAHVRIFFPPVLLEEEITRYPLILQVYGGPATQLVTDRWKLDWSSYLASNRDYIVVQIDARGSSGQGYNLQHQIYKKLGAVEVEDQLEVMEYLQEELHFIDKRRLAVWGWSYGGFITTMLLSNMEQKMFNCGIAVSPVVSWRLYDSAYTERFLGLPNISSNFKAYHDAELIKHVRGLHDKMLFLVHGTADDNVHLQQSMILAKALADSGVLYRQQIYPDENHSLNGVKEHLYRSMGTFLEDCFKKQMPPDEKAGLRNGGHDPPQ